MKIDEFSILIDRIIYLKSVKLRMNLHYLASDHNFLFGQSSFFIFALLGKKTIGFMIFK